MQSRVSACLKSRRSSSLLLTSIPVECIRKMRSLNVNNRSCHVSKEVYKILKSYNGRKIFT